MRTPESGPPFQGLAMREMITDRKTISIMKACELVGVSRRTIYNWIASEKVEYVRTAGGSIRIFVDTLWRQPAKVAELTRKEAS
jgi:excisionase family DNA binding protein